MSTDDLNGLKVGDLIWNDHQKSYFIIKHFAFEKCYSFADEHPYIVGVPVFVSLAGTDILQHFEQKIALHGSKRVTAGEIGHMMADQSQLSDLRMKALQQFLELTGE